MRRALGFATSIVTNQDLSPSIASKLKFLAVDLTVNLVHSQEKSRNVRHLEVPETIEWE
jgi:hypothetical protein